MAGNSSRRKGHDFERAVARRFREALGIDARRGAQSRCGADAPDVEVPGLWIECKCGKQTNPRAALRQAVEDSRGKSRMPLAVCKDDRQEPFVVLRLDDLLTILSSAKQAYDRIQASHSTRLADKIDAGLVQIEFDDVWRGDDV